MKNGKSEPKSNQNEPKWTKIVFFAYFRAFFFIFSVRYYISDDYKKKYYRGLESHKDKTITYAKNLPTLKNDTDKILTYVENNNTSKKKYKFWDLLDND